MTMQPNHGFPGIRTTERAVCELCGDEITTINGGRHTGSAFVHSSVCSTGTWKSGTRTCAYCLPSASAE